MSRHVEPIDRSIYNGRVFLGRVVTGKDGGFDAFNSAGKPLGKFNSEGVASHVILSGFLPRDDRKGGGA